MIKPDQFETREQRDVRECVELEAHIDYALKRNKLQRQWPLVIDRPRTPYHPNNISVVLEKYRNAGWKVVAESGCLATFDLPEGK